VRSYHLKSKIVLLVFFVSSMYLMLVTSADATEQEAEIPVPGLVTMVDLGAKKCVPCKMMAPILEELQKEYSDRAAIVFIDVWVNPDAGRKFAIRTIPTQIFFDAEGQEVGRHEGFLDKASIVAELQKLGVE
jgi:thioredoxin 1